MQSLKPPSVDTKTGYNQNSYSNPVQNTNNAFDSTFNANDSLDIASDDLPF